MKVPAFDLKEQYASLREELLPALQQVLERGEFILSENVRQLEEEIATYTGTAHGIGVANGSDALHLALMAYGIGPGDEVIVPAFTFFATAGAVARAGATPVLIDVDRQTFNVDVAQIEAAITSKTRAIIPVHFYGQAAPMEEIMLIARRHGLRVIEDSAQAIGAMWNGRPVCSFGDAACLSFYPTKNLGAYGDGGMILTNDSELAKHIRMLRAHGSSAKYHHDYLGYNSRLDEIQAAVLVVKLRRLSEWTRRRQEIAARYETMIKEMNLGEHITVPFLAPGNEHVYH